MAHDISLLKLRQPAQIGEKIGLACLPGSSEQVSDGKMCWVTGNEKPLKNLKIRHNRN